MATNLWTDVEALVRLAGLERVVADASIEARSPEGGAAPAPAPIDPSRAEFEIHAADLPAHLASGDFSDHFLLGDDTLVFVIGDVSGKGAPAAVLRAFARSMVRHVCSFSASPGEALERVNRMLCDARLGAMFVTIFLGWYDIPTGRLRYANAGHPRPYRIDAASGVEAFGEVTGPILGILECRAFGVAEAALRPGDRLVLYTDGVTEARNPAGAFLGPDGLEALLRRHATVPAARLGAMLLRAADAFRSGRRQDDATILTLKRNL